MYSISLTSASLMSWLIIIHTIALSCTVLTSSTRGKCWLKTPLTAQCAVYLSLSAGWQAHTVQNMKRKQTRYTSLFTLTQTEIYSQNFFLIIWVSFCQRFWAAWYIFTSLHFTLKRISQIKACMARVVCTPVIVIPSVSNTLISNMYT